jgi:hypothetical protein
MRTIVSDELKEAESKVNALYEELGDLIEINGPVDRPNIQRLMTELDAALDQEGKALRRVLDKRDIKRDSSRTLLKLAARLLSSVEVVYAFEVQQLAERGHLRLAQQPLQPPPSTGLDFPPEEIDRAIGEARGQPDLRKVVDWLVDAHRQNDAGLVRALFVRPELNLDDTIRLIEVTDAVDPLDDGELFVTSLSPVFDRGELFPVELALVCEEEFNLLATGEIRLPDGWGTFAELEEVREWLRHGAPEAELSTCKGGTV